MFRRKKIFLKIFLSVPTFFGCPQTFLISMNYSLPYKFRIMFMLLGATILFAVITLIIVGINKRKSTKSLRMQTVFPISSGPENLKSSAVSAEEYLSLSAIRITKDLEAALHAVDNLNECQKSNKLANLQNDNKYERDGTNELRNEFKKTIDELKSGQSAETSHGIAQE